MHSRPVQDHAPTFLKAPQIALSLFLQPSTGESQMQVAVGCSAQTRPLSLARLVYKGNAKSLSAVSLTHFHVSRAHQQCLIVLDRSPSIHTSSLPDYNLVPDPLSVSELASCHCQSALASGNTRIHSLPWIPKASTQVPFLSPSLELTCDVISHKPQGCGLK